SGCSHLLKMVRTMSLTLWTVIAEALGSKKQIPVRVSLKPQTGAMRPAMHGRAKALGLHSCRALSSWGRRQLRNKIKKEKSHSHPVDKPHTRRLAVYLADLPPFSIFANFQLVRLG